jgi:hypothetical protein
MSNYLKRREIIATDGAQMNTDEENGFYLCASVPHLWQKCLLR